MAKHKKFLEKIRTNHNDWLIDDLKKLAKHYKITVRQPGTSHVTFSKIGTEFRLTVPSHKPIKPIYIKKFIELLDKIEKFEGANE